MEFGLLGPLRVLDGEREIPLLRQKQRALLAFLLLHAGEVVSTDRLLDELWGERPPATAKNALHNYVSQIRKLLGADVLVTTAAGYVLEIDSGDVDVTRFERLLSEARLQAPPARVATLQRALALWRGPALAGLEFETFAIDAAPRLEELRAEAEEELVAAEVALGRHAEALPRIEDLVARHPLREPLREQLMLALYRSGRQADALAVYQVARQTLVDELGIEPGPALRELQQAVLRQDPALDADHTPETASPRPADLRERRTTVTVLFAEVAPREDLDPERFGREAARAFNELRAATEYHGGTVERLVGDELLAVFGVPERHEDDALRATRAALQIGRAARSSPELDIRIALDTGEVIAPGVAVRAPVRGAPVTRAKRLAEAAPPGDVVAAATTLELLGNAVEAEPLAALVPRGRTVAVPVYRIERVRTTGTRGAGARATLVGRRDELAALRAAFDAVVAAGRSAVFSVLGDAGIGKTRLAAELAGSLEDVNVIVGRCVSYGAGATWLPLGEIAQTANAALDDEVARAIEALLAGGSVTVADAFWAVRRLLEAAARERPALVVLEDLHWAAPTFLHFVEQLGESPVDAPTFVLCLARPELERTGLPADALTLEPLSDDETSELVTDAADASLPEEVRTRIAGLAEGNPLYAEQLVEYVRERGAGRLGAVPPTVEALIASRLDRLDAEERGALQRAAVVGREFWQAGVLEITPPLEVPAVGRHLDELARKGLIRAARSSSEREDALRFHHGLIRDVAYSSLPKSDRAELHERVASWLDAEGGTGDEIIGFHLEQAYKCRHELAPEDPHTEGLAVAAGRRLASAGLLAHRRGDSPASDDLLSRATALLPAADSVAGDLLCELAIAQWGAEDSNRAQATLVRALEAAETQQNRRAELRARIELANLRVHTDPEGRAAELLDVAQIALPVFEQQDDARSLGRTWLHVGFVNGGIHRQNEAWREATESALRYYGRTEWSVATCVGDLALALLLGPTPAHRARERCEQLLAGTEADRVARAHVEVVLAGLDAMLGRFAGARRLLADARTLYIETGFVQGVVSRADRILGRLELLADRPRVAERIFRECVATLERSGNRSAVATTASELAEAFYRQGEFEQAEDWTRLAEQSAASDDLGAQYRWRGVKAKLLAASGDIASADALALEAVELTSQTDSLDDRGTALVNLAEVRRHAGQTREAAFAAEAALAFFVRKENEAAAEQTRKLLDSIAQTSSA